ncbi:Hypothetical protein A7982_01895 [Minicystis rosea]|nr:Hypothetical protein A7982_01895 [Minicystis rosea]
MPNTKKALVDIDQLTPDQIAARVQETESHIEAIRALWPGLERLDEARRRTSPGKSVGILGGPLSVLFGVLRQNPTLAKAFDVLGDQDDGEDPDRFEVDLLDRRLTRAGAEEKIADTLRDLARHMDDDALATAESVVVPGLRALELARTLSKGNGTTRSLLYPVLDAFRQLTKSALKGKAKGARGP